VPEFSTISVGPIGATREGVRSSLPYDETTRTEIDMSPDMDFGPTHVDTALSMAKALRDVRTATSAPRPTPKAAAAVAAVPRPRPKRPDVSFRSYAHLSPCTDLPTPTGASAPERESSFEVVADVITVTAPFVAHPAPSSVPPPPRPMLPTPTAFVASAPSEDTARRLFSPFYAPSGPAVAPAPSPANETQSAFAALDDDAAVLAMRPRRSGGLVGAALLAVGLAAGVLFGASFASPPAKGATASHVAAATPAPIAPVADRALAQAAASPRVDLELPESPPAEKRVVATSKTKVPTVAAPQVTKVPTVAAPQVTVPSPKAPAAHALTSDGDTSAAAKLLEASRAATENTL
jgi:hypothetical protein